MGISEDVEPKVAADVSVRTETDDTADIAEAAEDSEAKVAEVEATDPLLRLVFGSLLDSTGTVAAVAATAERPRLVRVVETAT